MAEQQLAANVLHFARALRAAGLPVGTDRVLLAEAALLEAGLQSRRDFKAVLMACLVDRVEHRALFDQAFALFWRDPDLLGQLLAMRLPPVQGRTPPPPEHRRLGAALYPHAPSSRPAPQQVEIDAQLSASDRELLRQRDFESMSTEEWAAAREALKQLAPLAPLRATRRRQRAARGRIDWRATLHAQGRSESATPVRSAPRERPAPLLLLADISGSMSRYSRTLLHLAHGLANPVSRRHAPRVHSFVFGTRLTPITRLMSERDPDEALKAVSRAVPDWDGGTRLAAALREFNRQHARRVLTGDTTVLLITDGLAHDDAEALAFEARRLRLSCARLIWLNPLLRFAGFEPRAAGVRALLPEVSLHLPVHNLASLEQLANIVLCN